MKIIAAACPVGKSLSPAHRAKGRSRGPLSPETKAKLSAAMKGRAPFNKGKPLSSAHRAALSAGGRGRHHSPETRAKMSATHIGKNYSPETRDKLSIAAKIDAINAAIEAMQNK